MSEKVFDLGPIRPTSEGASLLLRVTKGCAWNRCRFCNNYRTYKFALRDVQELRDEIDMMADYRDRILRYRTADGFDMEKVYHRSARRESRFLLRKKTAPAVGFS